MAREGSSVASGRLELHASKLPPDLGRVNHGFATSGQRDLTLLDRRATCESGSATGGQVAEPLLSQCLCRCGAWRSPMKRRDPRLLATTRFVAPSLKSSYDVKRPVGLLSRTRAATPSA